MTIIGPACPRVIVAGCSQIGVSRHQTEPKSNLILAHASIWPTVATRASSARASARPNTYPNGGEWAEISVSVRRWSIETQREGHLRLAAGAKGFQFESGRPYRSLSSIAAGLKMATSAKSCNSCRGETADNHLRSARRLGCDSSPDDMTVAPCRIRILQIAAASRLAGFP